MNIDLTSCVIALEHIKSIKTTTIIKTEVPPTDIDGDMPAKLIRAKGSKQINVKYIAPNTVNLAKQRLYNLKFVRLVLFQRYKHLNALRLSETSLVLNVNASQIKQKLIINPANTRHIMAVLGLRASEKLCKKPR